jgi:hypothetical protein
VFFLLLFTVFWVLICVFSSFPGGKDYTPSRGELTRHVSLGRRGITTVQPGMEEFEGGNEHDDHDEINGIATMNRDGKGGDLPPVKKTMLGKIASKLRRHKDHKGDILTPPDSSHLSVETKNVPSSSPSVRQHSLMRSHSDGSGRATSPPSYRSQHDSSSPPSSIHKTFNNATNNSANTDSSSKKTPTKTPPPPPPATTNYKKSDKAKNTEASMLRQQIAATEYELTRFAKSIRKKVIHNSNEGGKAEKNQVTAEEYASLQEQQSELQQKLQKLRREHVELTGLTYEQAKAARTTLGRLLGGRKQQHPQHPQHSNSYDNSSYIPTAEATTLTDATVVSFGSPSSAQGSPSKEQMKHYFVKEVSNRLARPAHWITYK